MSKFYHYQEFFKNDLCTCMAQLKFKENLKIEKVHLDNLNVYLDTSET